MNYKKLIETVDGYDLDAAPLAVRLRYLRLTLRASMTFAAIERADAKYQSTLRRLAESLQREAAELAESFRFSAPNATRAMLEALRSSAAERLDRSLKRGRCAVIFCGRHRHAARILAAIKTANDASVVNIRATLGVSRRELAEKVPSHPFWGADAAQLSAALDNVDTVLLQATLNAIAIDGVNSDRSRELRDEVKRQLAAQGLNKYACAGVSCALAHAARKIESAVAAASVLLDASERVAENGDLSRALRLCRLAWDISIGTGSRQLRVAREAEAIFCRQMRTRSIADAFATGEAADMAKYDNYAFLGVARVYAGYWQAFER